ncbi:MAG: hypothetical protein RR571_01015 [Anaerorhabdus sp.]|jgi:hypothetical protein|uniref:hypothetical protein n=1 Tax=Anaerorhabdus sp. TaxID=1872524 RepID=UPI002FC6DFAB
MKKILVILLSCLIFGCSSKDALNQVESTPTLLPSPITTEQTTIDSCKLRENYIDFMIDDGFYTKDNVIYERMGESGEVEHTFNVETFELIGPYGNNDVAEYKYNIKKNTIDLGSCHIDLTSMGDLESECSFIEDLDNVSERIYTIRGFIGYYLFECDSIQTYSNLSSNQLDLLFGTFYK